MNNISDTFIRGERLDLDRVIRTGHLRTLGLAIQINGLSIPQYQALQDLDRLKVSIEGHKKLIYDLCILWKNEMNRPAAHVSAHMNAENQRTQFQNKLNEIALNTKNAETKRLATEQLCRELQAQTGDLSKYREEVIQVKNDLAKVQEKIAMLRCENEARKMQREQLEVDIEKLKNRIEITRQDQAAEIEKTNADLRATTAARFNQLINLHEVS